MVMANNDFTVKRVSLLQNNLIIGLFAASRGYIGAYEVPGKATILKKPDYLSICTEEKPDQDFILDIVSQIFGNEFADPQKLLIEWNEPLTIVKKKGPHENPSHHR